MSHTYPLNVPRAVLRHTAVSKQAAFNGTKTVEKKSSVIKLFLLAFGSGLLIVSGVALLGAMTIPALLAYMPWQDPYQPILPLSSDRSDAFVSIDDIPAKELYPPLASIDGAFEGNAIRIPALDINVPLVMSATMNDSDILSAVERGAALYPNGILPGRLGNTFIAAHSTGEPWKGKYRFAFVNINELQAGNELHIDYNKTRYTYQMTEKNIVTPSADFRVISNRPIPTVTLMACWPLWSTNKRMLITAELTNITKLTPQPILAAL